MLMHVSFYSVQFCFVKNMLTYECWQLFLNVPVRFAEKIQLLWKNSDLF